MATEQIFFAVEVETSKALPSLGKIRGEIQRLKNLNSELNKSLKAGTINQEQYGKAVAKNDVALKRLSANYREATNATSGLTKANLRFRDKMAKANAEMAKSLSLSTALKGAFRGVGAAMAGAFAARAVVQGISDAVRIIKEFEQASANLASVLGKNVDQIDALRNSAKELGATTSFTASQVLTLQTELAKLGFTEKEILGATEATLALAEAAGSELAVAAKVVGSTIRAFGLDAEDAGRVTDVMAKSFSSSALDISKFETAMASVAPAAKAANLSLEETTSLLGVLVDNGIDASTAGTALRGMLLDSAKAGRTLDESLELVNNATNKNATSFDLFGKRGAVVAQVLAENTMRSDQLEQSLINSGGAAKRMAETQLNTLEGRTKLLSSAWEGFVLSLDDGDGLISSLVNGTLKLSTNVLGAATSQEKLSDQLIQTNAELNAEFELLKDGNITTEQRSDLIEGMNAKYGDYIPNLLQESSSLKEIEAAQKGANKALKEKINLVAIQEVEARLLRDSIEATGKAAEIQLKAAMLRSGAISADRSGARGQLDQISANEREAKILDAHVEVLLKIRDEGQKRVAIFRKLNANVLLADQDSFLEALAKNLENGLENEAKITEGGNKKLTDKELKRLERERLAREKAAQDKLKSAQDSRDKLFSFLLSEDDKEIQALNKKFEAMFTLNVSTKEQELELEGMHQDALTALILKHNKRRLDNEKKSDKEKAETQEQKDAQALQIQADKQQFILSSTSQALTDIQELTNVFTQNKLNELNRSSSDELAAINKRESDGLISRNQAEQARRTLDDKTSKERQVLEKKEFQRNKAFQLAQIAVNLAAQLSAIQLTAELIGITTLGIGSIPYSVLKSGLAIGSAALNAASVAAQKFGKGGKLAKGGVISGPSHADGGVSIMGGRAEVEGSEIILTKGVTSNPTLAAMANQINIMGGGDSFAGSSSKYLEHGGGLSNILPTFELPQTDNLSGLLDAIRDIQINSTVSVSEINSKQANVRVSEGLATIG